MWEESGCLPNIFIPLFCLVQKGEETYSSLINTTPLTGLDRLDYIENFCMEPTVSLFRLHQTPSPISTSSSSNWKHRGCNKLVHLVCLERLQVNHALNMTELFFLMSIFFFSQSFSKEEEYYLLSKWLLSLMRLLLEFSGHIFKSFSFQTKHKVLKYTSKTWLVSIPHFK